MNMAGKGKPIAGKIKIAPETCPLSPEKEYIGDSAADTGANEKIPALAAHFFFKTSPRTYASGEIRNL